MEMKYMMDRSLTNLEKKVNDFLQDGWHLAGELIIVDRKYVQPMIKYEHSDLEDGQTKLTDFVE